MAYRSPNIYKVIVMSLYGEYAWMKRLGGGVIEISTKKMGDALHIKASALRDVFRWCEQFKYVSNVEIGYGYVRYRVNLPKLLLKEYGIRWDKSQDRKEVVCGS